MSDFSLSTAREQAKFCKFAYGKTPFPIGYPRYEVVPIDNPHTDIHASLIILPDKNVLAFRGTDSLKDWMQDADCVQVKWGPPGMKVHKGFLFAYLSVADSVAKALLAGPVNPLHITGHSLGAALASLCAFDLALFISARWLDDIESVHLFGCPRWCNRAGAAAYEQRFMDLTFRVTHSLDPVAHIPLIAVPSWPPRSYWKAGQHVWIDDSGHCEVNRPFWKEFPWALKCGLKEWRRLEIEPIPDHGIGQYIAALDAAKYTPCPRTDAKP